jgi:hypothetical protein
MVNDHMVDCHRHEACTRLGRKVPAQLRARKPIVSPVALPRS